MAPVPQQTLGRRGPYPGAVTSAPEPAESRQLPAHPTTALGWAAGTGAFLVELALIGTLAVAGHRLTGGPLGWVLGTVLVVLLVAVWAIWMSPRAPQRLPLPGRLVLGCGLVVLAAVLAHLGGLTNWSWWFGVVGVVLTVVGQTLMERDSSPA